MFAHQVIESHLDNKSGVALLNQAIKFHIGDVEGIYDAVKLDDGKMLFLNDAAESVNRPYRTCWFEYFGYKGDKIGIITEDAERCDALFLSETCELKIKRDVPGFFAYLFASKTGVKRWLNFPLIFYVTPGYVQKQAFGNKDSVYEALPITSFEGINMGRVFSESIGLLTLLNVTLQMLNCKNITTETVPAPVKLNNKRKKKGKLPIFSYKTLVIKPTTQKQKSIPKHLWNNRIHLARGHFKTYTKEAPLFGRITGRFWWQPHVRGQNRDGVIMKDYEVQT